MAADGGRARRQFALDRLAVVAAAASITAICWIYTASIASAPDMADHGSMMMAPGGPGWSAAEALAMLLMWAVMMVGMMTPSVTPMILMYARVARHASERGSPFAPTAWFATGYALSWIGFAAGATFLQFMLQRASLLHSMTAAGWLGGMLLILAGAYQLSSLKTACLSQCQSPFFFIQRHGGFRGRRGAAVTLGLRHGAYCIGCCWALMLLLFAAGVMNLLWIAAISMLVLIEKLIPGRLLQRASGLLLLAAGTALIATRSVF